MAIGLAAAGCQSGGKAGGVNLGIGGGDTQPEATAEKITESELRAYCPPLILRAGTAYYDIYAKRASSDPKDIVYQASIDEVTRSCRYNSDGSAAMTVAVAGKVVPGPAGKAGSIAMPIRIAVLRGGDVVSSNLHQYAVTIADTAGATQFLYNNPNVAIPAPVDRSVQVFVGYDRGSDSGG